MTQRAMTKAIYEHADDLQDAKTIITSDISKYKIKSLLTQTNYSFTLTKQ